MFILTPTNRHRRDAWHHLTNEQLAERLRARQARKAKPLHERARLRLSDAPTEIELWLIELLGE